LTDAPDEDALESTCSSNAIGNLPPTTQIVIRAVRRKNCITTRQVDKTVWDFLARKAVRGRKSTTLSNTAFAERISVVRLDQPLRDLTEN
jgi:hypothetical protein